MNRIEWGRPPRKRHVPKFRKSTIFDFNMCVGCRYKTHWFGNVILLVPCKVPFQIITGMYVSRRNNTLFTIPTTENCFFWVFIDFFCLPRLCVQLLFRFSPILFFRSRFALIPCFVTFTAFICCFLYFVVILLFWLYVSVCF